MSSDEHGTLDDRDAIAPNRPLRTASGFVKYGFAWLAIALTGIGIGFMVKGFMPHPTPTQQTIASAPATPGTPPPAIASPDLGATATPTPPVAQTPQVQATVAQSQPQNTAPDASQLYQQVLRHRARAINASQGDVPNPDDDGDYTPPPVRPQAATPTPKPDDNDNILVSGGTAASAQRSAPTAAELPPVTTVMPSLPPAKTPTQVANDERLQFASRIGEGHTGIYSSGQLVPPLAPTEVFAGEPVHLQLDDGINSSMPGNAYAHITDPVYSSLDPHVIVFPKATRVVIRYNPNVQYGDGKMEIACDWLILPNGDTFDLGGMQGSDPSGENGLNAHVDDHHGRIFTTAFLTAVISAGAGLAGGYPGSILSPVNPGQVAAGAAGQAALTTGNQLLSQRINQPPTLTVERGRPFMVRLTQTIIARPWHNS